MYLDRSMDPYCDRCQEKCGLVVLADGFCQTCSKFLCKPCCTDHWKYSGHRKHQILASARRSSESNPARHSDHDSGEEKIQICSNHPDRSCNILCLGHAQLLCRQCISDKHKHCSTVQMNDPYSSIDTKAVQEFKRKTDVVLKSAVSVKGKIENNIEELQRKQDRMMTEAEAHRDNALATINELYAETETEIKAVCQDRVHQLSTKKGNINGIIKSLKKSIKQIEKATENGDTQTVFIKMQAVAESIHQYKLRTDNIHFANVSFTPAFQVNDLRSWGNKLGNVTEVLTEINSIVSASEDVIPVFIVMEGETDKLGGDTRRQLKLNFKAVKSEVAKNDSEIVGMCFLKDGKLLIADSGNRKLNIISPGNQQVSTLSLPFPPAGIALSGTKLAIATYSPNIYFVNVANQARMLLEKSVLKCEGSCITSLTFHGENLAVTSQGDPSGVKLLDKHGVIIWKLAVNQTGLFLGLKLNRELFEYPIAVVTRIVKDKTELVVADSGKRTITFIDIEKGHVINTISTDDKRPTCITADTKGKIYMSYVDERKIDVLVGDAKSFATVLHEKDLRLEPAFIIYDIIAHELLVCYNDTIRVDRFHIL